MTEPPLLEHEPVPHRVRMRGHGMRLLDYLVETFTTAEPAELERAVAEGRFAVRDGPVLAAGDALSFGWTLMADIPHKIVRDPWLPPPPRDQSIVFMDRHLVAIDKVAGLLSYPMGPRRISALTLLEKQLERAGEATELRPAHRLDKETTGLLMMTRDLEADRAIKRAFVEKEVGKTYLALVRGHLPRPTTVDGPIARDKGGPIRIAMTVDHERGRPALTELVPLGWFGDKEFGEAGRGWTWVQAVPRTGRTHQIRLHLAHVGHPIVGDKIYCDEGLAFLRWWDGELDDSDLRRLELKRHALHAWTADLAHPVSGEPLHLRAPVPPDMVRFAEARAGQVPVPRGEG